MLYKTITKECSMDISLSNNIENILKSKVAEGIFKTIDEAVNYAIQFAFVDNNISLEKIESLNAEIEKGWQDMEAGRLRDGNQVMKEFLEKYAS